ncbi:MAG TPA: hypothetical protein VKV73_07445 [Chloroflexota bacterium]|nr:hypothetical protein [Chloroflexota bacterium]
MELLILIALLFLLDLLAMRFGVDSRRLDPRDTHRWWPDLMNGDPWHDAARTYQARLYHEAHVGRLAGLAKVGRPPIRLRLADGLRSLAVRIDPASCLPGEPVHVRLAN